MTIKYKGKVIGEQKADLLTRDEYINYRYNIGVAIMREHGYSITKSKKEMCKAYGEKYDDIMKNYDNFGEKAKGLFYSSKYETIMIRGTKGHDYLVSSAY